MSVRRLSAAGLAVLHRAVNDPATVERFRSKVVQVPGSHCLWWTGAISGRGHGRFWFGRGRVIIAHRFAFALAYGVEALDQVRVLGHRCDNPLCQRVGPGHVVASSAAQNRREWVIRRLLAGTPLADPRGPRRRARELRDLARQDPSAVAADLSRLRERIGEQLPLW